MTVVRTWRRRFAIGGIPGLFDEPRSGRPETHGPSARLAVLAVATSVPPGGEPQWWQRAIAVHLGERGLAISPARPYKWSYDAGHARYLERHPQPEPLPALPEAA